MSASKSTYRRSNRARRYSWVFLALSALPGVMVMSRALPPDWIHAGISKHGSGSTQVILLIGGLYIACVGMFLCRALLPVGGRNDGFALPAAKRLAFASIISMVLAVAAFGLAEVALRTMGQKPWRTPQRVPVAVDGRPAFTEHPTLGYTHAPGKLTFRLWDAYTFSATHLPNTLRMTRPMESPKNDLDLEEIWLFGCSFTHGWSVEDDETYPWLLDAKLSRFKVVNFGVTGYGTLHSLIQLNKALTLSRQPRVVVLAYASFHDERNTFQRSRRKVTGRLHQPHARLDEFGRLQVSTKPLPYREFPGMRRSAFIHAIERYYNQRETVTLRSHDVSKAIIREFANVCQKNDLKLVVAGIDTDPLTREMLRHCARQGIWTADISVDLGRSEYNNRPHDGHPSAAAHRKYAEKLHNFLIDARLIDQTLPMVATTSPSESSQPAEMQDEVSTEGAKQ